MNKVLFYALPEFKEQKIDFLILSGKTLFDVIKGVLKLALKNPFSFDFIVFNSLAAVSKKYNRYWKIYLFFSFIFCWKKVVYWHEMPDYFNNFWIENKREANKLIKYFNKSKVLHFAVSDANSLLINRFFFKGGKKIVYNTVNVSVQKWNNFFINPTVLTIGSIQEIKGTDLWTEVAIAACRIKPNLHFLWCGSYDPDNKLYLKCQKKILENNLGDRIRFMGYINNPIFLLQSSHLYFLPSRCDSMPLVVLEAMTCGKNIIHYNSGGVVEAVGNFGILIDNFSINTTVNKIISLLDSNNIDSTITLNVNLINRYQQLFSPAEFVKRFILCLKA